MEPDFASRQAEAAAVRKFLLGKGWELAWIDGVTGELRRRKISASVEQMEQVVRRRAGGEQRARPSSRRPASR